MTGIEPLTLKSAVRLGMTNVGSNPFSPFCLESQLTDMFLQADSGQGVLIQSLHSIFTPLISPSFVLTSGFSASSLSSLDLITVAVGACPVHHGVFLGIPGLYSVPAAGPLSPDPLQFLPPKMSPDGQRQS